MAICGCWLPHWTLQTLTLAPHWKVLWLVPAYHMNGKVATSFLLMVHLCDYFFLCLKKVISYAIHFSYMQKNTRVPLMGTTGRLNSPPAFGDWIIVVVVKGPELQKSLWKCLWAFMHWVRANLPTPAQKIQIISSACLHLFTLPVLNVRTSKPASKAK